MAVALRWVICLWEMSTMWADPSGLTWVREGVLVGLLVGLLMGLDLEV